jgi:hypothetical protein
VAQDGEQQRTQNAKKALQTIGSHQYCLQSPLLSWITENIYLIVQTFGSKAALQAEHLTVFSNSSEKIAHSLPHSGHLIFTSFKVLLLSNPGQC